MDREDGLAAYHIPTRNYITIVFVRAVSTAPPFVANRDVPHMQHIY